MPAGTGGTVIGLEVGLAMVGLATRVVGVRVTDSAIASVPLFDALARDTLVEVQRRGYDAPPIDDLQWTLTDAFYGDGYGVPLESADADILWAREALGLELEPTYTAKTIAALRADGHEEIPLDRTWTRHLQTLAPGEPPPSLPLARFLELGAQFDLGVLVDMDDALGTGGHHAEPDLGERIGRGIEHPAHFGGHVLDGLLPGRGDEIARDERLAEEIALERLRRTLQAHLALRGREYDTRGRARFGNRDIHMLARASFRIAALKPVEPDDVDGLVFVIGRHRDRRGRALAGDFHHIAFGDAQRLKGRSRHAGDTLPAFLLPCRCDLQSRCFLFCRRVGFCHQAPVPRISSISFCPS